MSRTIGTASAPRAKPIQRDEPDQEFARAILAGLQSVPKSLPSRYLYDERGDRIFQQIMELPEYYLTRCEDAILRTYKDRILEHVRISGHFNLVELGAGDGKKTRILLTHFLKKGAAFSYMPVDISTHALEGLCSSLRTEYPSLEVRPFAHEYFAALDDIGATGSAPLLVLFMGGNIGNFGKDEARRFMSLLCGRLKPGDLMLAGFDLKKDPAVIYHAYNDRQGVTRSFNFNLLRRINRELGADFVPEKFIHYPTYDPVTGAMKSYLIAVEAHTVQLRKTGAEIRFAQWEPVFMEVSNKYGMEEIRQLCGDAGFDLAEMFTDKRNYYANVLLKKR